MLSITRFPAFILLAFATSGKAKPCGFQSMLSAKLSQVMHCVFLPTWGDNQGRFCIRRGMPKRREASLFSRFCAVLSACLRLCHIALCFLSMFIVSHRTPLSLCLLRRRMPPDTGARPTKLGNPAFLTRGLRDDTTKTRASNTVKIKALLPKGIELLKPVLFSCGQGYRQNQFQDFEGKSVGAIFIPGCLQFWVMVLIALKIAEMSVAAAIKVYRATNVDFSGNSTGDAVNARCGGYGRMRVHLLDLLNRFSWCTVG